MTTSDRSDDELEQLTDQQLLKLLTDTDLRMARLQHEVRRRMQSRAQAERRAAQHAEISRMVEHLNQTTVDWQKVREFFRDSLVEAQQPRNNT
ncbi:hypothetical protein [Enteractinococcus helveticum]|uniref:Uncharacterized protein n=1 Tax=Enteractinococcus helveticum TaxID=1837282 RepID=A0A1B7M1R3_9MICC|nr:hypothetical protein [Enteractinococcus helveticum]OAV62511.1 hypothetical protein A6F49_06085 [Enteractinococcus helveticum]